MKTKHTQGTWYVDGFNTTSVISCEDITAPHPVYKHVCNCDYGHLDPLKYLELNNANAKLIAAAPELLEALGKLLFKYEFNINKTQKKNLEFDEEYINANAAIKKATT